LSYFVDVYTALGKVAIALQLQYRASGMIWMIGTVLEPVIYLVVWSTVAQGEGGSAGGFTPHDFAAYYIAMMFVNHLTFSWIMHEFQFRIQTGSFSFLLLRPIHPIHGDIADNLAYKLVMMVVMIPAAIVLTWLFEPNFDVSLASFVVFLPTLVLAFFLRFFLEWSLALAAFWTTRVNAINQTYFAVMMFLSGRIAPIALLPVWLQTTSEVLPFYWTMAFPVEVLLGRVAPDAILRGLGIQALWTAIGLAVLSLCWRSALRRFSAVGA
jgi:ABC-2 type transport system permease protein